jgi:hypothetical protein
MKTNLDPYLESLLKTENIKSLLEAANTFVSLLEDKTIDDKVFVKKAHLALVNLYSNGIKLPEIDLKYSKDFNRDDLFDNKYAGKINNLGIEAFYWEVFDPAYAEEDKEATQGWLNDDFSDIYKDIKIEIEKIKLGTNEAVEDGLWSLKWGFINHWGNHCINAMRALHYLWYDGK